MQARATHLTTTQLNGSRSASNVNMTSEQAVEQASAQSFKCQQSPPDKGKLTCEQPASGDCCFTILRALLADGTTICT